jgi:nitrogen fixation-related uncharacterized protein
MKLKILPIAITLIFIVAVFLFITRGEQFDLPEGESIPIDEAEEIIMDEIEETINETNMIKSNREVFITDDTKHSIPLNEILSGGPGKDGIPSIDNPKFISIAEADKYLNADSVGLGIVHKGEARFYPYQILVFHEIVNDAIAGDPLLITYCPLCATGVVFERKVGGRAVEFGVSGMLWQSNLLMYNRSADSADESLWSQVLGEAVLGKFTGTKLVVLSADTVRYGDWKKAHSDTKVLSRDTGAARSYGTDPYGSYYTDDFVGYGASFNDTRLHAKEFVLGIEVDGAFKAYHAIALSVGATVDAFAGEKITIEKNDAGEVRMFVGEDKRPIQFIGGFWFSWLAVHPNTELYK